MELLLLRHAEAVAAAPSDFARQLTAKGVEQAERVARFVAEHELAPDLILTSPVLRARQTAALVVSHNKLEILEQSWLACGMDPETAVGELQAFSQFDRVMLVGHEPDFSTLAAYLLGLPGNNRLRIRKASLTLIQCKRLGRSAGELHFSICAKYM